MSTKTPAQRKADKRQRLYDLQGGRCYWCKCEMDVATRHIDARTITDDAFTFDHLYENGTPERAAGNTEVVGACYKCNQARQKAQMESPEYQEYWRKRATAGITEWL